MENERVYTKEEVARMRGVSPQAVHKWLVSKKLKGYQNVPRGRWYIKESELKALYDLMQLDWVDE